MNHFFVTSEYINIVMLYSFKIKAVARGGSQFTTPELLLNIIYDCRD